jgi:Na+-transporting NADH:ubiquinone oxidoreductase subunit B
MPTRAGRRLFLKQPQMIRMVYALLPLLASAVYFFGWRALAITAVVAAAGFLTEFVTSRARGAAVSQAVFVTCLLFALSLPPTTPFFVAVIGIVVAVLFGKEVFGGFGRNFANPAIVGRAFIYVCFPKQLTGRFVPAFKGFPGGLAHWSFESLKELPAYLSSAGQSVADAVTQASPMWVVRDVNQDIGSSGFGYLDLLLGNIGGVFRQEGQSRILAAGSMGEGCAVLILLAAAYLLITRTANYRLMLGAFLGFIFANVLFRNVLGYSGLGDVPPMLFNLLAGTTLYVMVFMVTDPVSAPRKAPAQWAYAVWIGFCIVFLRWRGVFVAAASFAVLTGNLVGPLMDLAAEAWENRKKAPAAAKGGADG